MKALITGGTGFVGSHLVAKLQSIGCDVLVVSRCPPPHKGHVPNRVKFYAADLTREDSLEGLPTDIDYVFHLAAIRDSAGIRQCYATNVGGTKNLLRAIRKKKDPFEKICFRQQFGRFRIKRYRCPEKRV